MAVTTREQDRIEQDLDGDCREGLVDVASICEVTESFSQRIVSAVAAMFKWQLPAVCVCVPWKNTSAEAMHGPRCWFGRPLQCDRSLTRGIWHDSRQDSRSGMWQFSTLPQGKLLNTEQWEGELAALTVVHMQ